MSQVSIFSLKPEEPKKPKVGSIFDLEPQESTIDSSVPIPPSTDLSAPVGDETPEPLRVAIRRARMEKVSGEILASRSASERAGAGFKGSLLHVARGLDTTLIKLFGPQTAGTLLQSSPEDLNALVDRYDEAIGYRQQQAQGVAGKVGSLAGSLVPLVPALVGGGAGLVASLPFIFAQGYGNKIADIDAFERRENVQLDPGKREATAIGAGFIDTIAAVVPIKVGGKFFGRVAEKLGARLLAGDVKGVVREAAKTFAIESSASGLLNAAAQAAHNAIDKKVIGMEERGYLEGTGEAFAFGAVLHALASVKSGIGATKSARYVDAARRGFIKSKLVKPEEALMLEIDPERVPQNLYEIASARKAGDIVKISVEETPEGRRVKIDRAKDVLTADQKRALGWNEELMASTRAALAKGEPVHELFLQPELGPPQAAEVASVTARLMKVKDSIDAGIAAEGHKDFLEVGGKPVPSTERALLARDIDFVLDSLSTKPERAQLQVAEALARAGEGPLSKSTKVLQPNPEFLNPWTRVMSKVDLDPRKPVVLRLPLAEGQGYLRPVEEITKDIRKQRAISRLQNRLIPTLMTLRAGTRLDPDQAWAVMRHYEAEFVDKVEHVLNKTDDSSTHARKRVLEKVKQKLPEAEQPSVMTSLNKALDELTATTANMGARETVGRLIEELTTREVRKRAKPERVGFTSSALQKGKPKVIREPIAKLPPGVQKVVDLLQELYTQMGSDPKVQPWSQRVGDHYLRTKALMQKALQDVKVLEDVGKMKETVRQAIENLPDDYARDLLDSLVKAKIPKDFHGLLERTIVAQEKYLRASAVSQTMRALKRLDSNPRKKEILAKLKGRLATRPGPGRASYYIPDWLQPYIEGVDQLTTRLRRAQATPEAIETIKRYTDPETFRALSSAHRELDRSLEVLVAQKALLKEDVFLLRAFFGGVHPTSLGAVHRFRTLPTTSSSAGRFIPETATLRMKILEKLPVAVQKNRSRVFLHEYFHAWYYNFLEASDVEMLVKEWEKLHSQKAVVNDVETTRAHELIIQHMGLENITTPELVDYYAGNPYEFFAELGAGYALTRKTNLGAMQKLWDRLLEPLFQYLGFLKYNSRFAEFKDIKPWIDQFEKALKGERAKGQTFWERVEELGDEPGRPETAREFKGIAEGRGAKEELRAKSAVERNPDLPDWVNDQMIREGKNPMRLLNEEDAARPKTRDQLANDPLTKFYEATGNTRMAERMRRGDLSANEYRAGLAEMKAEATKESLASTDVILKSTKTGKESLETKKLRAWLEKLPLDELGAVRNEVVEQVRVGEIEKGAYATWLKVQHEQDLAQAQTALATFKEHSLLRKGLETAIHTSRAFLDPASIEASLWQWSKADEGNVLYRVFYKDLEEPLSRTFAHQAATRRFINDQVKEHLGFDTKTLRGEIKWLRYLNKALPSGIRRSEAMWAYALYGDSGRRKVLLRDGIKTRDTNFDVKQVLQELSPKDRAFVDSAKRYFGNNYFVDKAFGTMEFFTGSRPEAVDGWFTSKREYSDMRLSEDLRDFQSNLIKEIDALKARSEDAGTPFRLDGGFVNAFYRVGDRLAMYAEAGQDLYRAERLLQDPKFQSEFRKKMGEGHLKNLQKYLGNIRGLLGEKPSGPDAAVDFTVKSWVVSRLGLNIRSAAKQFLTLLTTYGDDVFTPSAMRKALVDGSMFSSAVDDRMQEWSGMAFMRLSAGRFAESQILTAGEQQLSLLKLSQEQALFLQKAVDTRTSRWLWRSAELTAQERGLKGREYREEVTRLFERALGRNQTSSSPLFVSDLELRAKGQQGWAWRGTVSFQRELNRIYSTTRRHVVTAVINPTPENLAKAGRAILWGSLVNSAMEVGINVGWRAAQIGGAAYAYDETKDWTLRGFQSLAGRWYLAGDLSAFFAGFFDKTQRFNAGDRLLGPVGGLVKDAAMTVWHTGDVFAEDAAEPVGQGINRGRTQQDVRLERAIDTGVSAVSGVLGLPFWALWTQGKGFYTWAREDYRLMLSLEREREVLRRNPEENAARLQEIQNLKDEVNEVHRKVELRRLRPEAGKREIVRILERGL